VKPAARAKRGRPSKFGRPSQVAALTLPDEVVHGLRKIHPDLAWAIVTLFEKSPRPPSAATHPQADAELVKIADRRSLIVVNRAAVRALPGINIIPLDATHAFLALDAGRGMADLELAVLDRLEGKPLPQRERKALTMLRDQLSAWRHDRTLKFHPRSIIVVERLAGGKHRREANRHA
jgi:hypothetical protein